MTTYIESMLRAYLVSLGWTHNDIGAAVDYAKRAGAADCLSYAKQCAATWFDSNEPRTGD